MHLRHNRGRVFQRAFHNALTSTADKLVHEMRAQTTSAHDSKTLRETRVLTSNAGQCSARVDMARRRAKASKYSALILKASEYTGCAQSSAMNPRRGSCPLLLDRLLLRFPFPFIAFLYTVYYAAALLKKGEMRWRKGGGDGRL